MYIKENDLENRKADDCIDPRVKMLVPQSCLTLYNVMDCSSPSPLFMEFSRQEYWRGLPFPSPGYLPNPGIKPRYPALQTDSLLSEPPGKPIPKSKWCL